MSRVKEGKRARSEKGEKDEGGMRLTEEQCQPCRVDQSPRHPPLKILRHLATVVATDYDLKSPRGIRTRNNNDSLLKPLYRPVFSKMAERSIVELVASINHCDWIFEKSVFWILVTCLLIDKLFSFYYSLSKFVDFVRRIIRFRYLLSELLRC